MLRRTGKKKESYLDKRLSQEQLDRLKEVTHASFDLGSTVGGVLKDASSIGYGGHFDELSDYGANILSALSGTDRELLRLHRTLEAYCEDVRQAVLAVEIRELSDEELQLDEGPFL